MGFEIILLVVLAFSIFFGVPLYAYFRNKSLQRKRGISEEYTKSRVLKLTVVNFLLNFYIASIGSGLFLSILQRSQFNSLFSFPSLIFTLSMLVTFYGNGIYITSVVLEYYTLPQIKRLKQFKTQFLATHLFHGPISHILIYSGWLIAFLALSLMDIAQPHTSSTNMFLPLILLGSLSGLVYAAGQIYNGTAAFQLVAGVASFFILTNAFVRSRVFLFSTPIALYFSAVILTFNITLLIYLIHRKIAGEKLT